MSRRSPGKLMPTVAWPDAAQFLLFGAAALALLLYGDLLSGAALTAVGCLTGVALGLVLARIGRSLLGPVLFYELVRTARRGRYVLLRCIYALVLLAILWSVYWQFNESLTNWGPAGYFSRSLGGFGTPRYTPYFTMSELHAARYAALARFAEAFFSTFIIVQLLAVVLLTPAYTAGTIAEEKDRKTLEFLLATDLKDHEIVLSKLIACMANVGILVLTGLPILGLMQLLGGVDPNLVLAGYAVTLLTLISIAAISILVSVNCKKARDAIVLSYLTLLAYIVLSWVCQAAIDRMRGPPAFIAIAKGAMGRPAVVSMRGFMATSGTPMPTPSYPRANLLELFTAGNVFLILRELREAWDAGTPLTAVLPGLVKKYAVFHGLVAFYCVVFAVLQMRKAALTTPRPKKPREKLRLRHWFRPSLGRQPMVWKEVFAEPGMAFGWLGKAIVLVIVVVSLAYPLWVVYDLVFDTTLWRSSLSQRLPQEINAWVRLVGTTVACLTLLGVAVRAAGSVTAERDRQTLDNLLTTPMQLRTILYAKWLGSILSVRAAWLWLFLVWGIGVGMGGLDLATLPWLLLMWLVYATFFACVGLRFSLTSPTSLRATLVTLATLAGICMGPWLILLPLLLMLAPFWRNVDALQRFLITFQTFGMTPPVALGWFAFHGNDVGGGLSAVGLGGGDPMLILTSIVNGLVVWGLAAGILWRINLGKFAGLAGRTQVRLPQVHVNLQMGWGP